MGLKQLLSRTRDELRKAEDDATKTEEDLRQAAADKARAENERDRAREDKKSWKEKIKAQMDTVVMVGSSVPAAMGVRAVRKRVNIAPSGFDMGGVAAFGAFVGAVVNTGKKYGAAAAGVAAGLACEFALHRMDPVAPPPKKDGQATSGLEEGDEEAGALPAARRSKLTSRIRQSMDDSGPIGVKDVIDMP